jgi:hypothetical protein
MPSTPELRTVDDFDELVRLVEQLPDLFVRYSKGPSHDGPNGTSRDYESGVDMPGLSVTTIAPESWWPRDAADWVARRVCKYDELHEEDRFPWLLTGRVVGFGPDHEPLVMDIKPVARVGEAALARAREIYESRFDVARSSRG